jgi:hypothetical protein
LKNIERGGKHNALLLNHVLPLTLNEISNDFTHGVSHEIFVIQDAMNYSGDVAQASRSFPMLSFKIAKRCDFVGVSDLELLEDQILLRMMTAVRVVFEVVNSPEEHVVIRSISALEYAQFPLENTKQFFHVSMFATQDFNDLGHNVAPSLALAGLAGVGLMGLR